MKEVKTAGGMGHDNFNVLKTVGIYGPNNAGKTCLIKCIRAIKNVFLNKRSGLISNIFTASKVCDFELNKEGNKIIKCPAGHSPISCFCSSSNGHIHASFSKEACMNCPHKNECKIKEHKNVCSIDISATAQYRATTRRYMKTDEFKALARLRNGVETLPSLLRNKYHVNHMTVRGKIRSRFFFGCKVAALNIRKLFTFRNGLGNYWT